MCNTCGCRAAEEINPVDSVIVEAPLGRGVAQFYAEGGDMATYSPSQEPDMTSPATEPTNANFSAESKSMFGKDKNGKMYARRRNGRIITHNAESFGAEYDERFNIGKCDWAEDCKCEDEDVHCSKCNYNLTTSGGRECPNGCFDEKGAETFEARENKDGTIVLTENEWYSCLYLYNGNYLYKNKELKLIGELKSGVKFEKVRNHSDDALKMIHHYENLLRKMVRKNVHKPNKVIKW